MPRDFVTLVVSCLASSTSTQALRHRVFWDTVSGTRISPRACSGVRQPPPTCAWTQHSAMRLSVQRCVARTAVVAASATAGTARQPQC